MFPLNFALNLRPDNPEDRLGNELRRARDERHNTNHAPEFTDDENAVLAAVADYALHAQQANPDEAITVFVTTTTHTVPQSTP